MTRSDSASRAKSSLRTHDSSNLDGLPLGDSPEFDLADLDELAGPDPHNDSNFARCPEIDSTEEDSDCAQEVDGDPMEVDLLMAGRPLEEEGPPEDEQDDARAEMRRAQQHRMPTSLKEVGRAPGAPRTVFDALVEYGLLRKLTDIVLAKVAIPWHLRADATQEVHVYWASLTANPNYEQNQVAHYAYLSGQHAALKLRRTIGAVVTIPGALFRTGRDTSFMEAIGAAVNPKDVEDYKDSLDLSIQPEEYSMGTPTVSAEYLRTRLAGLSLTKTQRAVAERALVRRMPVEDIAEELGVRTSYVERQMLALTQMLNDKDEAYMRSLRKDGASTPEQAAKQPEETADKPQQEGVSCR